MKSSLKNKWFTILLSILFAIVLIAGTALISSGIWDRESPMVPLDYLTDELEPNLLSAVDEAVDEKLLSIDQELAGKLQEFQSIVDSKVTNEDALVEAVSDSVASMLKEDLGASYREVQLTTGTNVTLSVGSELLFRQGSIEYSTSIGLGLIDISTGNAVEDQASLELNHLYVSTMNGCTLIVQEDSTVFIHGEYSTDGEE